MSKLTYAQTTTAFGWQDFASCQEVGTDLFFPKGPAPAARRLCRNCPVQAECLEYALDFERLGYIPVGIYGGFTADEREAILFAERNERRAA